MKIPDISWGGARGGGREVLKKLDKEHVTKKR